MFLKVTGDRAGVVLGEADDSVHAEEIVVTDWGWGMSSPSAIGGSAPTGRISYGRLWVRKVADTASTALMSMMNVNETGSAVLSVRKPGGEAYDYLIVTLSSARIVDFRIESGYTPEGAPCMHERIEFAFRSIEVEYSAQSGTGAAQGASTFVGDAYGE
jgi:type VI secretion system secreted protein Hcp